MLRTIIIRPWLMSSVRRQTEHVGQTTITLTGLHAHFEKARVAPMRLSTSLQGWVAKVAEQLDLTSDLNFAGDHLKLALSGTAPPNSYQARQNHADKIG